MAMEVKTEITGSNCANSTGASKAGPACKMLRKYSYDIGNGNRNNNGRSYNHIGKGSNNNSSNNVVDILDLAVPQSKVRPIDRLLDRYDWSSASMTPLLQDSDRPQRKQDDQPPSRPRRSAPSPPSRPQAPSQPPPRPPPPTRPPSTCALEFSDRKRTVRKSLWKRTRDLVSSFFVRAATAAVSKVDCHWSR